MFGRLGDVQFARDYGNYGTTATEAYRYAEHAVIEGKPLLQPLGEDLQTFEMQIRLDIAFCTPDTELAALRTYARGRQPVPLFQVTSDLRSYAGRYVIEEIVVDLRKRSEGRIVRADLTLRLREYVPAEALVVRPSPRRDFEREERPRPAPTSDIPRGEIVRQGDN